MAIQLQVQATQLVNPPSQSQVETKVEFLQKPLITETVITVEPKSKQITIYYNSKVEYLYEDNTNNCVLFAKRETGIYIHPHALRKSCATVAYNQTNDLLRVQKLMGHSRPETTSQYAIVDNLKEFHSRALGQNHEFIYQSKKGGEVQIEIKGWCKEGGKVTSVRRAIRKAVNEV